MPFPVLDREGAVAGRCRWSQRVSRVRAVPVGKA